ncbi:MAG: glucodextranase DOMON-like domain-containing protein [Anaerolineae bacterium]|nr:glucodextranase DOMON-like domain-containing protein [Anaerolineae bacterium]
MSDLRRALLLALIAVWLLAACGQPAPTPTPTPPAPTPTPLPPTPTPVPPTPTPLPTPTAPAVEPLYLNILWHQHQPVYFKDPETGVYQKPWVRVHAAKDYVDMAAILEGYPDIVVTFNLTPSLLRQLLDLKAGAKDLYQVHTEIPAAELTAEQKQFILSRFFDINPKIIARFPRYQQLADTRGQSDAWTEQDWRDLQVLFNLGWTDPDWLAQEPLAGLVAKGRDFAEADKAVVLAEHARLVAQVIPLHKRLQDEGRIEITTTPFYHPILPLIFDTDLAKVAAPDLELPPRFSYPLDAVEQVKRGVQFYTETFGRPPVGMWPAEGAVAQEIVNMVGSAGIRWMATDEEVLARSLGRTNFARNAQETVQDADALYRPYIARTPNQQVYVVFRDKVISDKVGFTYSGTPGKVAARDFVDRILAIRAQLAAQGAAGPHLVSVILDGENAWEHYPNDGKEFLHEMYRLLEEEQGKGTIRTITPGAFIARFPEQRGLERLWAGSWVSPDYLTWIGEDEENRAWEYLGRVRDFARFQQNQVSPEVFAQMMEAIYTAEGSDWFWWYGADQNSGDDGSFDAQFRATLARVYEVAGQSVPTFLKVPVIPERAQPPAVGASGLITPTVDGVAAAGEWDGAGYFLEEGGVQATPNQVAAQLWYGFDKANLYLRLDARRAWADVASDTRVGFYLRRPGGGREQPFSRTAVLNERDDTLLGFGANALVEVAIVGGQATATFYTVDADGQYAATPAALPAAAAGSTLEVAVPYEVLGKPNAGDVFKLRAVISEGEQRDIQTVPGAGPAELIVPDLGLTTAILTVDDPEGDDHGPGTYTYPTDSVFVTKAYDLKTFAVAEDEANLIFRFAFYGPLNNAWGAPNGMGIHTLDVYIDAAPGGERKLLPGRNAAVPADQGWEFAVWAEGWTPGLYGPPAAGETTPQQIGDAGTLTIISDPGQRQITIRVPKRVLAERLGMTPEALQPKTWRYLGVVLSQEGFPSSGVWRVRDVLVSAQQWRVGGAPANSTTHTRILDVAYPAGFTPTQEEALSNFTPQAVDAGRFDQLSPDDFAQLPMLAAE